MKEYHRIIFAQLSQYGASFLVTMTYTKETATRWLKQCEENNFFADEFDRYGGKNVMITHHDTLAECESVNKILID